jgi:hypothetical protein
MPHRASAVQRRLRRFNEQFQQLRRLWQSLREWPNLPKLSVRLPGKSNGVLRAMRQHQDRLEQLRRLRYGVQRRSLVHERELRVRHRADVLRRHRVREHANRPEQLRRVRYGVHEQRAQVRDRRHGDQVRAVHDRR